jgi:C1A family cysteine protease
MKNHFKITLLAVLLSSAISCTKDETTPDETNYGTGLKFNSKEALEQQEEVDFDETLFDLPASFAFDGPPIVSQEETSKCVGFSGAYYIVSLYNGVKSSSQNLDKAGSPEFAYAYWKKINKDTNCDEGAYMFDEGDVDGMAETLKNVGTTSWNQVPFVNTKTCTITTESQKSQAASNRISGYARLDEDEYKDVGELKSWIYAGYPLWIAVTLDDGFNDLGTSVWTKQSGASDGGHAMTVVGWDDAKKAFKVANSWGKDWGDKGHAWIGYNYLIKLLQDHDGTIGVLFPNETQKAVFNKLTPSSCGNAGWGELNIENKLAKEVKIVLSAGKYLNDDTSIDANEKEYYYGVPKGSLKVKTYDAKDVFLKEYNVNITQCQSTTLLIN